MDNVRIVVIGFGGMGRQYVRMIHEGLIDGLSLAGVCCRNEEGRAVIRENYPEAVIYKDVDETFAHAAKFDAVLIVTPHDTHAPIGKRAFAAGLHVLCDKPAGVSSGEVEELMVAAAQAGTSYAMLFNTRMKGAFQKAKEVIQSGGLGQITRALWVCNTWYRTPAYHNSAPWRSTWKGEHGGLLINQCQHNLDIWQWLFGMPDSLYASVDYGKYNDFTVDDSVDLQLYYRNGMHGTFISASGENPGINRLELWGTMGKLTIENSSTVMWDKNIMATEEFEKINTEIYGTLEHEESEIYQSAESMGSAGDYRMILQNFSNHIINGESLCADGGDGYRTLMLANGAYLSSWLNQKVSFPIDSQLYETLLAEKVTAETKE